MIDISCKFYLQKNDMTYTYCINLVEEEVASNMQRIPQSSSFIPCENQRITVKRYECFMENRNIIRKFCGCTLFKKKKNIEPHQNFTYYYKKHKGSGLTSRYIENQQ